MSNFDTHEPEVMECEYPGCEVRFVPSLYGQDQYICQKHRCILCNKVMEDGDMFNRKLFADYQKYLCYNCSFYLRDTIKDVPNLNEVLKK